MTTTEIVERLASLGSAKNVEGMSHFGIATKKSFGVSTPVLKQFAREVKKQAEDRHALAQELWETGIYDARAVAFLIDDPKQVTKKQMEHGRGILTTGQRLTVRAAISFAGRLLLMKRLSNGRGKSPNS